MIQNGKTNTFYNSKQETYNNNRGQTNSASKTDRNNNITSQKGSILSDG